MNTAVRLQFLSVMMLEAKGRAQGARWFCYVIEMDLMILSEALPPVSHSWGLRKRGLPGTDRPSDVFPVSASAVWLNLKT